MVRRGGRVQEAGAVMSSQHECNGDAGTRPLRVGAYIPAHNPAVHGHAYAVKAQGTATGPFTAVPPLPPRQVQYEQPCPYGCPVRLQPLGGDPRILLYAGPGIATRNWVAKVREGAWDDIPALFDAAHARVHLPAIRQGRHIRRDVSDGRHHLAVVFDAHPDWRTDPGAAEGLHRMEAEMPGRMAELRGWVARRAAEYRAAEDAARRAA